MFVKKCLIFILTAVFLTGCGAEPTFETVTDEYAQPVTAVMQQAALQLPDGAAAAVMQNEESGTIYFCNDYTLTLQTLAGGDLSATLLQTTGYPKDQLKLIKTQPGDYTRYDCVWACAGEGEDQVGRAAVLDDGSYHYVLTCMTGASCAQDLQDQWQAVFGSFCLTAPGTDLYTGS